MSVKISHSDYRTVTVTLTLPTSGLFDETLVALKAARAEQHRLGNIAAAQSLHTVVVLAEGGKVTFETATSQHIITPSSEAPAATAWAALDARTITATMECARQIVQSYGSDTVSRRSS